MRDHSNTLVDLKGDGGGSSKAASLLPPVARASADRAASTADRRMTTRRTRDDSQWIAVLMRSPFDVTHLMCQHNTKFDLSSRENRLGFLCCVWSPPCVFVSSGSVRVPSNNKFTHQHRSFRGT